MGLKLTIRHCLLAGCAFLLLAPVCATSSKTAKPGSARAKKKAAAAKAAAAVSSSDAKGTAQPQSPDSAKPAKGLAQPQSPDSAKPAKGASKAATAVVPKKPAPPPEPPLPSRLPQPLYCPIPSEVQAGTDLTIRCAVKPALATKAIVLNYRPSGTDHFVTTDAIRSPKGWYVVNIKASEVRGSSLQFYAQAYNAINKMTAANGTDESPNILLIRRSGSGTAEAGGPDQPAADEDPLARIQRERDVESGLIKESRRRPARTVWAAVGMGSGYGWFPSRTPELYPDAKVTGWASGGILHLMPEIGYQWTDHIAFSVQGRYQFVHTESVSYNGAPAKSWAWAVLGRMYLFSDRIFGSASNLQLFGTGSLGGGTAFRLYVAPHPNLSNPGISDFRSSDSVHGGPVVAGLGGGLAYHPTSYLTLAAELRALAGFWDVATVIEAGLSAQLSFWTLGARGATAAEPVPELAPEVEYTPPD